MSPDRVRETLRAGGVPIGSGASTATMPSRGPLRESLARSAEVLAPHELDAVAAWLAGFRHHWPSTFDERVGDDIASDHQPDPDRFLKLRRIAIANLARTL